jgi:DNA polymerase I-like protein with 3'-5' exonuclease and polymerase domains
MREAYRSGDPYLTFARQAGAVPPHATKHTHADERERFKLCALGVQYGMGARSLAARLGVPVDKARDLLRLHRQTYPTYWRWSREVGRRARRDDRLQAAFGWTLHVGSDANPRSVRNFPLQANGAEMLRLACISLTEAGVRVCAPVHDALLVEAPLEDIEDAVEACQRDMAWASRQVLGGLPLRTEAKVVKYPARYMEPRGWAMWERVFGLLDEQTGGCGGCGTDGTTCGVPTTVVPSRMCLVV